MNCTVFDRKLLVVEDDSVIRKQIVQHFRERCNQVYEASTLGKARELIEAYVFDAIILDLILPDGEGLELFSEFHSLPPVIILSNLATDANMLEGFTAGATDYIAKPCSLELLEARLSLRMLPKADSIISSHGLILNTNERSALYHNTAISLTGSEFNILYFLMSHPGIYYNAAKIYENVWQAPSLKTTSVKYHISNLRQKLIQVSGKNLIRTEFGKGYSFLPKEAE